MGIRKLGGRRETSSYTLVTCLSLFWKMVITTEWNNTLPYSYQDFRGKFSIKLFTCETTEKTQEHLFTSMMNFSINLFLTEETLQLPPFNKSQQTYWSEQEPLCYPHRQTLVRQECARTHCGLLIFPTKLRLSVSSLRDDSGWLWSAPKMGSETPSQPCKGSCAYRSQSGQEGLVHQDCLPNPNTNTSPQGLIHCPLPWQPWACRLLRAADRPVLQQTSNSNFYDWDKKVTQGNTPGEFCIQQIKTKSPAC